MLGLRPPGLEFRILWLEDSVISFISPSSGGSPGPVHVHKGGLKPDSFYFYIAYICTLGIQLFYKIMTYNRLSLQSSFIHFELIQNIIRADISNVLMWDRDGDDNALH